MYIPKSLPGHSILAPIGQLVNLIPSTIGNQKGAHETS